MLILVMLRSKFFAFGAQQVLEYITYPGALTISLGFWLRWFIDMVLEANVRRGHRFESQPTLIEMEYSAPMRIHPHF